MQTTAQTNSEHVACGSNRTDTKLAAAKWRSEKWAKDAPSELAQSLDNLEHDDKQPPTLAMAVKEAAYVIGLHYEGGTTSQEMLDGEFGPEAEKEAKATIRDCKRFIKKYSATAK